MTQKLGERRGFPIYKSNPSLETVKERKQIKATKVIEGNKAMIFNGDTGEVTGEGSVAFLEREIVDPEKFVKLYLSGLDGMFELTKSGQRVFKVLWCQVQAHPNRDRVELTKFVAEDHGDKMTERVFQRGVRELLEKEFIYMSSVSGMYFFNVEFIFNGNRIITAKEYVLKNTEVQPSLPFEE